MNPTIGRIVHYKLSEGDVALIDRDSPQKDGEGHYLRNPVAPGDVYPAMVVRTFGGTAANIKVFLDGHGEHWATSRGEGDQPGSWAWPPRV